MRKLRCVALLVLSLLAGCGGHGDAAKPVKADGMRQLKLPERVMVSDPMVHVLLDQMNMSLVKIQDQCFRMQGKVRTWE